MIDHPSQDKLVFNWAKLPDREETLLFYFCLNLTQLNSEPPSTTSNITNELPGVINQRLRALRLASLRERLFKHF